MRRRGPKKFERQSGRDHHSRSKPFHSFKDRSGRVHGLHHKRRAESIVKLKATVDKNRKGFAFLIFDDEKYEDSFVPPSDADRLFHGDRVEVTLSGGEAIHVNVLEHRFRELVGRFTPHPHGSAKGGWVVYERKKAREEVFAPKVHVRVEANDWVRASLHFHESGPFPVTAEILEIYGKTLPASADVGMVAAEFNLIEEHSAAAKREARELKLDLREMGQLEGREDLRNIPFITIDGETARDFDDAIYVEREKSGHVLWVAIADVSHYVRHGTALDKEGRSRGTSVYFPERAFHMLPRALSENLCSLKPNEPRLALVAKMKFNHEGRRHKTEVFEALIESRRRATYNQIESEWKANHRRKDWEYAPHFELYEKIKKTRIDRGSIDFDLPEAEVVVDKNGEVISIKNRERLDSHRLIEEFMITANEAVTEWMMERNWPFVYRIHEEPAQQSLLKFQKLAANVGVRFSLEESGSPRVVADLVKRLEGHPAQTLLNMALLRSMKQAVYSSTHHIHYGLASQAYTHFTSPIRRYPDLVVHRLIREVLRSKAKALKENHREKLEKELADICEHCSYRERLAADADREAVRIKQVRAIMPRLGDEFEARIVGMIDAGFFIQIEDPYVEGLVSKESLTDDFYQFNEERMIFYGKRKRRTFKVGDCVSVRALRADLDRRQIDFGLTSS